MPTITSLVRLVLGLAALFPASSLLADSVHDDSDRSGDMRIAVVTDLTEAGKRLPHPTPEKPAYYIPITTGYKKEGDFVKFFQESPPPTAEIQRMIAKALASQGYLVAINNTRPSLILAFRWGSWAPIFLHGVFINQAEMETLVSGAQAELMTPLNPRARDAYEAARQPRWGVVVTAFDFDDQYYRHKVTILWRECMSTELWGHYIDEVLPTLIASGAPMFGRQTTTPQLTQTTVIPEGHVVVGAPYINNSPSAPAAPK